MVERKARKEHECDDARWRKRIGAPVACAGTIAAGETYCEVPEWQDEPFHPPRYHRTCYERNAVHTGRPL